MRYVVYALIALIWILVILNNTGALRVMVGWFDA